MSMFSRLTTPSAPQCLVALGGGVIGDLVGYVAATYMRGVPVGCAAESQQLQRSRSFLYTGRIANAVGADAGDTDSHIYDGDVRLKRGRQDRDQRARGQEPHWRVLAGAHALRAGGGGGGGGGGPAGAAGAAARPRIPPARALRRAPAPPQKGGSNKVLLVRRAEKP
jgi:hypothetical protein